MGSLAKSSGKKSLDFIFWPESRRIHELVGDELSLQQHCIRNRPVTRREVPQIAPCGDLSSPDSTVETQPRRFVFVKVSLTVDGDVAIGKGLNLVITDLEGKEDHPAMFVGREKQKYDTQ